MADSEAQDDGIYVFPVNHIAIAAKVLLVCVALGVLLIPVFLLYLVSMSNVARLIVILVSLSAFVIVLSSAGVKVEGIFIGTCTCVNTLLESGLLP